MPSEKGRYRLTVSRLTLDGPIGVRYKEEFEGASLKALAMEAGVSGFAKLPTSFVRREDDGALYRVALVAEEFTNGKWRPIKVALAKLLAAA